MEAESLDRSGDGGQTRLDEPSFARNDWGLVAVAGLAVAAFCAQVWYLGVAEAANTDEGAMGEAGRLMLRGQLPHTDFPWFHFPGLPLLIATALKLSVSLYALRVLYLGVNCLAVIPLYWWMQRARSSRVAGVVAMFFFLSYHQMVHHDLRFLAVRQLANTLFIGFLAVRWRRTKSKASLWLEIALAVSTVMVFLPAAINLLAGSLAVILSAPTRSERIDEFRRSLLAGAATAACVGLYFALLPNSFQQAVVEQMGRAPVPATQRIGMMLTRPDAWFYVVSCTGLACGLLFCRELRGILACMLLMVVGSTVLPSNFYHHYPVVAAPAFCFGVYVLVLQFEDLATRLLKVRSPVVVLTACAAICVIQAEEVARPLADVWFGNRSPGHHELLRRISTAPGPLMTAQAIYGVEAGVELLPDLQEIYLRSPVLTKEYTNEMLDEMARKAGTILIEPRSLRVLPMPVQKAWIARYPSLESNTAGVLLLAPHEPNAPAQAAADERRQSQ